jgi:hypothetical protein
MTLNLKHVFSPQSNWQGAVAVPLGPAHYQIATYFLPTMPTIP